MITIEASNIYYGGGFTLLSEMLERLENRGTKVKVYIVRQSIVRELTIRDYKNISIIPTTPIKTLLRYMFRATNVLYFCSLPPFVRSTDSVVYAHNPHILSRPEWSVSNMKFILYHYWVRLFKDNVNLFACQTDTVAQKLKDMGCIVEVLPFYTRLCKLDLDRTYNFCYISTVAPHKNHSMLFNAVELAVNEGFNFNIVVTVRNTPNNLALIEQLEKINQEAGREVIVNRGFVGKEEMEQILGSTKTLVFPSLKETLGLPLVEAMYCGLRIISADKPYSHDLVDNPILFDPQDAHSIKEVLVNDLLGRYDDIVQSLKVEDRFDELITKITSVQ